MKHNSNSLIWGIILIIIGVGFMGNIMSWWNFELFFEGWWALFIILPCLFSIINSGIRVGNAIGLTIGILLLLNAQNVLPDKVFTLFWPLIIVAIGLSLIFRRPTNNYNNNWNQSQNDNDNKHNAYTNAEANSKYKPHKSNTNSDANPFAIFCGAEACFTNREFYGGNCTAVFGGVELDLRGAIITNDVTINATAVFGGVDIFVDNNVQVRFSSTPIFGGTDCNIGLRDDSLPTVFVNCVAVFGGIDIK